MSRWFETCGQRAVESTYPSSLKRCEAKFYALSKGIPYLKICCTIYMYVHFSEKIRHSYILKYINIHYFTTNTVACGP
jgi:hypothetical protein